MLERLYGVSSEEYFKLPYASNSGMKDAHALLTTGVMRPEDEEIPAYYFGSAMDAFLTDPEGIHTASMSDDLRKKLLPMASAIEANDIFKKLFSRAAGVEHQAVFIDKEFVIEIDGLRFTIPIKCKYDWWNPRKDLNFGGDLKTTAARSEQQFRSAAQWFDYPQQAALYMDITGTDRFPIIAVSTYNYATYNFNVKKGDAMYNLGRNKYLRAASSWWQLNGSVQ